MKRTFLLTLLIVPTLLGLLAGCSKGDDKGGQKTIPGDYSAEPGKGGNAKAANTP